MTDSFGWTFGSEWTRDKILADRVAGLESHAAATTSRLRSQLNKVQGNLEKRLDALTAAFDAYVELGDIREQLLAHADTSGSRRQAAAAFEAMLEGRTAPELDTLDGQYWLPYAVNALIAVVQGAADPEAEEAARRLTPDADRFIVMAAGALGHGEAVRDRVPDLLVGDGTLTEPQVLLWSAALEGVYGDVLPAIREVWAGSLENPDVDDWLQWVSDEAGSSPEDQLGWLDRQTGEQVPAPVDYIGPADVDDPAEGDHVPAPVRQSVEALRSTVTEMIEAGVGEEQELLTRARELRATIEDPEGASRRKAAPAARKRSFTRPDLHPDEGAADPTRPRISELVRSAWLTAPTGSSLRTELDGWVRPGLAATASAITLKSPRPAVVQARSSGGSVDVVASGPKDPKRVTLATQSIHRQHERTPWARWAYLGGAALCLVLAIVTGVGGSTGWPVLFAIGAIGLGGAGAWEYVRYARSQQALRDETAALEKALTDAADQAAARDRENHLQLAESQGAQKSLVSRLATTAAS